jgi:hypothetical protein
MRTTSRGHCSLCCFEFRSRLSSLSLIVAEARTASRQGRDGRENRGNVLRDLLRNTVWSREGYEGSEVLRFALIRGRRIALFVYLGCFVVQPIARKVASGVATLPRIRVYWRPFAVQPDRAVQPIEKLSRLRQGFLLRQAYGGHGRRPGCFPLQVQLGAVSICALAVENGVTPVGVVIVQSRI